MNSTGISAALEGGAGYRAVQKADEQVLVRQAQAGNRPAFEELVRRYDRDVLRLALNLLRGSEDARDVYQEVFSGLTGICRDSGSSAVFIHGFTALRRTCAWTICVARTPGARNKLLNRRIPMARPLIFSISKRSIDRPQIRNAIFWDRNWAGTSPRRSAGCHHENEWFSSSSTTRD